MAQRRQRPIHRTSYETMIAWGCLCGARWMNEALKGKTDEELVAERTATYAEHLDDVEGAD